MPLPPVFAPGSYGGTVPMFMAQARTASCMTRRMPLPSVVDSSGTYGVGVPVVSPGSFGGTASMMAPGYGVVVYGVAPVSYTIIGPSQPGIVQQATASPQQPSALEEAQIEALREQTRAWRMSPADIRAQNYWDRREGRFEALHRERAWHEEELAAVRARNEAYQEWQHSHQHNHALSPSFSAAVHSDSQGYVNHDAAQQDGMNSGSAAAIP
jgi:hypothetical protein